MVPVKLSRKLRSLTGGWQYRVYFREDKVVKKPRSVPETALRILFSEPSRVLNRELVETARDAQRLRRESVEEIEKRDFDMSMFANPVFRGDTVVQDRVEILGEKLSSADMEEGKALIDRYIDFTLECWSQGFCDRTFNYTINNGVKDGEIVLVDVGELTFSREEVAEYIENQKWLTQYSYVKDTPDRFKEYIKDELGKRLTLEELENKWASQY